MWVGGDRDSFSRVENIRISIPCFCPVVGGCGVGIPLVELQSTNMCISYFQYIDFQGIDDTNLESFRHVFKFSDCKVHFSF